MNWFLYGNSYLAANGVYDAWHYLTIVNDSWSSLSINMPQVANLWACRRYCRSNGQDPAVLEREHTTIARTGEERLRRGH